MKIVHVISSLERGGAQAVLLTIVKALAHQEVSQVVFYFHDGPYCSEFKKIGIRVERVGLYRLYKATHKYKPDLIHSVLWAANWASRLIARTLHIPCVISLHNNIDQNGGVRNALDRINSFYQTTIIAISDQVKNSFYASQNNGADITVIENGIDPIEIEPIQISTKITRESLALLPEHFVIGSVGRFVPIKRYSFLLDAFSILVKEHCQARLLLVGTGPEEENLRAYAQKIGISNLVTWVIDQPAQSYYSLFNCFALTSQKEGISIALLEAMSYGLPCLVTHGQEPSPIVKDGYNGIVAHNQNATSFARKITLLIKDQSLCNMLGTNAQRLCSERFSKSRMIAAYSRIFIGKVQRFPNR